MYDHIVIYNQCGPQPRELKSASNKDASTTGRKNEDRCEAHQELAPQASKLPPFWKRFVKHTQKGFITLSNYMLIQ